MDTCPFSPQLSAYIDNELSDAQRREVEAHLETACAPCHLELQQWRRLSALLASASAPQLSAQAREGLYALAPTFRESGYIRLAEWTTALAASVLVAAAGWMVFGHQAPQTPSEPSPAMVLALNHETADLTSDTRSEPQLADLIVTELATAGHK